MARKFFDHEHFNFEFQFALGGVHYGAGDLGEMLSTADRIVDGEADSWCREWIATGQRVAAIADGCTKGGHNKSARAAYMRAAAYFTVALSSVDSTKDPAIPTELRQLLDSGDKQNFDRFFEEGMQAAPRAQRQKWEWRA